MKSRNRAETRDASGPSRPGSVAGRVLTIATAGHVDHGKSSLVERLTGVHPDRLPEERARGLSIALGYADLELPDGTVIGFVDVPGHERFVRTATSGASGVDALLLVVAADDGVMPQTVEHADVARHLGIDLVAIIVTKTDRVDPGRPEQVRKEAEALLLARGIESVGHAFVSNETGEGLDDVRLALQRLAGRANTETPGRPFRMSVARVFTKEGFGTVVTGVPSDGRVRVGDEIVVSGLDEPVRVRGVEVLGAARESARAGERTALNLAGSFTSPVVRGDTVHARGAYPRVGFVEVLLDPSVHDRDSGFRATRARPREVRLLHGAAERAARGYIVRELERGRVARFQLDGELPVRVGDRVCLWSPSGRIVGGGRILATVRSGDPSARSGERAERRAGALDDDAELLARLIEERARAPVTLRELDAELSWGHASIEHEASELERSGRIVRTSRESGPEWLARSRFDEIAVAIGRVMRQNPSAARPAEDWARETRRAPRVVRAVLEGAVNRGLVERHGERFSIAASPGSREGLRDRVLKAVEASGLTPLDLPELAERVGETEEVCVRVRDELIRADRVVRLAGDHFAGRRVLEFARDFLRDEFGADAIFRTGEAREKLGVNRTNVIRILEFFDRERWTTRVGDGRGFV